MPKPNEEEIRKCLKEISQISPPSDAVEKTIKNVRKSIIDRQSINTRASIFVLSIAKFAAAAVIFICFGFLVGRLSSPKQVDIEQLQANLESSLKPSIESAIKEDVLEQVQQVWTAALETNNAVLQKELQQQINQFFADFATQILTASQTITDRRYTELIELIEAARQRDRSQIETAIMQIQQQTKQVGTGLVALATQTDELLQTKDNEGTTK